MKSRSSVIWSSLNGAMQPEYVNRDLATLPDKETGSNTERRLVRPVRPEGHRDTWPRAVSRLLVNLNGLVKSKRSFPSLTNLAQWYLDTRVGSEGSTGSEGLIYSVPCLPPQHSAETVAKALDVAVAALQPQPEDPAIWKGLDEFTALFDHSLTSPPPPAASEDTQTCSGPLIDPPKFPDSPQQHPLQAFQSLQRSLIDDSDLPDVPLVKPNSKPVDNFVATEIYPATLCAPFLPTPTNRGARSGFRRPDIVPTRGYPCFQRERRQTEPRLRRKTRIEDLKPRAATSPELRNLSPQRTPTCLRVGIPVPKSIMTRKVAGQDSLKIRLPSGVKEEDTPPSLQHGGPRTGLSPGSDAEVDCLISAVDVVKEGFELRPDPVHPDLGKFSFELPSPPTSRSASSNTLPPPPSVSSPSSSKRRESLHHVNKITLNLSDMDSGSRNTYINRPLPPFPLAPEPMPPVCNGPSANLALSNATLKALLSAEDESSHFPSRKEPAEGEAFARDRLSKHSAAVVREFSEFTNRRFFRHPLAQEVRSQSDGTVLEQRAPQHRTRADIIAAASGGVQLRARSAGSLAMRKQKGRGIVFDDPEEWKRQYGG